VHEFVWECATPKTLVPFVPSCEKKPSSTPLSLTDYEMVILRFAVAVVVVDFTARIDYDPEYRVASCRPGSWEGI
jgi:hypothetical protein